MRTDRSSAHPISVECERSYFDRGFMVVEDFFCDADLLPVIQEIDKEVDRRAHDLRRRGLLASVFADQPFDRRLAVIYESCREVADRFDIKYLLTPELFQLITCTKVLGLARYLLGPNIVLNPTHRLRPKLPQTSPVKETERETDPSPNPIWHQDVLTNDETDSFDMFTIWVPLVDAAVENGCLQVMPNAFRLGRLPHRSDRGGCIREDALPRVCPLLVPCPRGGIIVFNQFTPHSSVPNSTDSVRWSLDFRFQRAGITTGRPGLPALSFGNSQNADTPSISYDEWRRNWIEALQPT
jgi:phytanoyl-CoA hydroxylase